MQDRYVKGILNKIRYKAVVGLLELLYSIAIMRQDRYVPELNFRVLIPVDPLTLFIAALWD